MFLRLLNIEVRKTLKHPALWAGLAALLLLLMAFTLVQHAQIARGYGFNEGGLEQDLLSGFAFFSWVGPLVYGVTATVIAAYDYPERGFQTWLSRGVPRHILMLSRLTTILLFGWCIVVFTALALLGCGALSRILFFGMLDASRLNLGALLPATLRIFWGSLPYLALTVFLAVLGRSPLFAAGGMLFYATVLERLLGGLANRFPTMIRHLPAQQAAVLLENTRSLDFAALPLDPNMGLMPESRAVFLAGMTFLALGAIALVLFSRQDLGG